MDQPYACLLVASAVINALDSMNLYYPRVSSEKIAELERIKQELLAEE